MEIRIEALTKQYGKQGGISSVNLTLPSGGLTAIVGPSGCGKTTLLRTLSGLLAADSGRIWFGRDNVTALPPQKRGATMVFQNYALWPHMSVYDNIAYGLKLRKIPSAEIERRVMDVLRRVEIDTKEVKKRHPQHYSGGQQQRIALARALVVEPKLLLMDEPLSNLDAKVRQRLRVEIRSIQQAFGITALYVTHDQEEALSMADYVVVMNKGHVEQAGSPQEVYYKPASYFTAQFLGDSHTLTAIRGGATKRLVVRSCDAVIMEKAGAAGIGAGTGEGTGFMVGTGVVERVGAVVGAAGDGAGLEVAVSSVDRSVMGARSGPIAGSTSAAGRGGIGSGGGYAALASDIPEVQETVQGFLLKGVVSEYLFIGSSYRHMVKVGGGQTLFADSDRVHPVGEYHLFIPRDRAYWFELEGSKPAVQGSPGANSGLAPTSVGSPNRESKEEVAV